MSHQPCDMAMRVEACVLSLALSCQGIVRAFEPFGLDGPYRLVFVMLPGAATTPLRCKSRAVHLSSRE